MRFLIILIPVKSMGFFSKLLRGLERRTSLRW
jgi:hypothetical protein